MRKSLDSGSDLPTTLKNAIQEHTSSGFLLFYYDAKGKGVVIETASNERDKNGLKFLSIEYHNKQMGEE